MPNNYRTPKKNPFHDDTLLAKMHFRRLRLDAGLSMNEGASAIGVSRKQLEDIETARPYGCHCDWLLLCRACVYYKVDADEFRKPIDKRDQRYLVPRQFVSPRELP